LNGARGPGLVTLFVQSVLKDDSQSESGRNISIEGVFKSSGQGLSRGVPVVSVSNEVAVVEPMIKFANVVSTGAFRNLQAGDTFAVSGTIEHDISSTGPAFALEVFDTALNRTNPLLEVV